MMDEWMDGSGFRMRVFLGDVVVFGCVCLGVLVDCRRSSDR
jgi:hypothetical protein